MFYPATGSFRRFGVSEGLANEVIYGILPDDAKPYLAEHQSGNLPF